MRVPELSDLEYRVLIGLARGQMAIEIADDIHVARETIANYIRNVYRKLSARNAANAVATGYNLRILSPDVVCPDERLAPPPPPPLPAADTPDEIERRRAVLAAALDLRPRRAAR
jgi:DNA-binding CsgD family transcriptional regulator